jgi:HlyD family secretion protein
MIVEPARPAKRWRGGRRNTQQEVWVRVRIAVGVVILAVIGGVAAVAVHKIRARDTLTYATAPVTVGRIQRDILTTGTIAPTTKVEVGTQISGTVASVLVDFNSIVHKGEVLARLEPQTYQSDLTRAQASLLDAQARLASARVAAANAKVQLQRAQKTFKDRLITEADLNAAQVAARDTTQQVISAQSQIVTATANVNAAKVNLDRTVITSPIDGIVVSRLVEPGQTVAARMTTPVMFELAPDLQHMQLEAMIDESEVGGVHQGVPVEFTVGAYPNAQFHGTLRQVRLEPIDEKSGKALPVGSTAAAVDTGAASGATSAAGTARGNAQTPVSGAVVGYTAIVDVANPDERLRPGMTAVVTLPGAFKDNVTRIPNVALSFQPPPDVLASLGAQAQRAHSAAAVAGNHTAVVWQLDAAGRPKPLSIRTGLSDSQWTEMAAGSLHANDRLITSIVRGK